MSFIQRIKNLFSSDAKKMDTKSPENTFFSVDDDSYSVLPEYIAVDPENNQLVSTVASVIAAGDQNESVFKITDIKVKNPEFTKVAVIVASMVATDFEESSWKIVNIKKRGN
ncbi:hypothetical protein [Fundicoccus culcitae]|uniref:Uncharacterized protein n=1 Tax=Fundicoccus culcitae TaxID=2969821 RepID=A0ABY5P3D1_9LACT|nr:hypothetical protein [Fundicoccus culcitae]UUX33201.1 hypothetical protein NRE15_09840 [Fundicoccus culcitae]